MLIKNKVYYICLWLLGVVSGAGCCCGSTTSTASPSNTHAKPLQKVTVTPTVQAVAPGALVPIHFTIGKSTIGKRENAKQPHMQLREWSVVAHPKGCLIPQELGTLTGHKQKKLLPHSLLNHKLVDRAVTYQVGKEVPVGTKLKLTFIIQALSRKTTLVSTLHVVGDGSSDDDGSGSSDDDGSGSSDDDGSGSGDDDGSGSGAFSPQRTAAHPNLHKGSPRLQESGPQSQSCSVLSSQNEMPSSQNEMPSSQNEMPSNQNEMPSSQNEMPSSQNEIPSSQNEMPSSQNEVHIKILNEQNVMYSDKEATFTLIINNFEKKNKLKLICGEVTYQQGDSPTSLNKGQYTFKEKSIKSKETECTFSLTKEFLKSKVLKDGDQVTLALIVKDNTGKAIWTPEVTWTWEEIIVQGKKVSFTLNTKTGEKNKLKLSWNVSYKDSSGALSPLQEEEYKLTCGKLDMQHEYELQGKENKFDLLLILKEDEKDKKFKDGDTIILALTVKEHDNIVNTEEFIWTFKEIQVEIESKEHTLVKDTPVTIKLKKPTIETKDKPRVTWRVSYQDSNSETLAEAELEKGYYKFHHSNGPASEYKWGDQEAEFSFTLQKIAPLKPGDTVILCLTVKSKKGTLMLKEHRIEWKVA